MTIALEVLVLKTFSEYTNILIYIIIPYIY